MARLVPEHRDPYSEAWAVLLETAMRAWEVRRLRAAALGLSAPLRSAQRPHGSEVNGRG